jgi:hypothetical protein
MKQPVCHHNDQKAIDGRKQDFYPFLTGEGFTRCRFVTVEELMKKLLTRRIGSRIDEYEC